MCCRADGYNEKDFARARCPGKVAAMLENVVQSDTFDPATVNRELAEGMDPRKIARAMYWRGYKMHHIAKLVGEKYATVYSWKRRDKWEEVAPFSRIEQALDARLQLLISKPHKTGGDYKEIDMLGRQIERMARVERYSKTGNEADLNPKVENRNAHLKDDTWKKKRDAKRKADAGGRPQAGGSRQAFDFVAAGHEDEPGAEKTDAADDLGAQTGRIREDGQVFRDVGVGHHGQRRAYADKNVGAKAGLVLVGAPFKADHAPEQHSQHQTQCHRVQVHFIEPLHPLVPPCRCAATPGVLVFYVRCAARPGVLVFYVRCAATLAASQFKYKGYVTARK